MTEFIDTSWQPLEAQHRSESLPRAMSVIRVSHSIVKARLAGYHHLALGRSTHPRFGSQSRFKPVARERQSQWPYVAALVTVTTSIGTDLLPLGQARQFGMTNSLSPKIRLLDWPQSYV